MSLRCIWFEESKRILAARLPRIREQDGDCGGQKKTVFAKLILHQVEADKAKRREESDAMKADIRAIEAEETKLDLDRKYAYSRMDCKSS